ncbi:hypothetical protein ACFOWE_33545 [Planomonospora corallina]|uniref:Uncharacterized protein n=1 Tax=Planomonospora corallina TaxID=1806052 RepID=A0ABV8IGH2_9ACTN
MKRLTTGLLTVAATATVLAIAGPAPAQAAAPAAPAADKAARATSWGPYYSDNNRAYARGTAYGRSGSGTSLVASGGIRVRGYLYDRDYRTTSQGGLCAYAQIQGYRSGGYLSSGGGWDTGRTYKHCGTNNHRLINYSNDYADYARIRVCQIRQSGGYPVSCGGWRYLRDGDQAYGQSGHDREHQPGYAPSLSSYMPGQPKSSEVEDPNLIEDEGEEQGVQSTPGQEYGQLPSNTEQMPADSGYLPNDSQQLPAGSGYLPNDSQQLPAGSGYLPSAMQNPNDSQSPSGAEDEGMADEGIENEVPGQNPPAPGQPPYVPGQAPAQTGQAPAQTGQAPAYAPGLSAEERPMDN